MGLVRLLPAVRITPYIVRYDDLTSQAYTVSGMVHPAFGVLYSKGISGFSDLDSHQRQHDGDRTALWLFTIAILSTCTIGIQNYMFASAAATLTAKLQSLSFRAILRQDSEFRPYKFNFVSLTSRLFSLQLNSLTRTKIALGVLPGV
jgi:hypothetical protein